MDPGNQSQCRCASGFADPSGATSGVSECLPVVACRNDGVSENNGTRCACVRGFGGTDCGECSAGTVLTSDNGALSCESATVGSCARAVDADGNPAAGLLDSAGSGCVLECPAGEYNDGGQCAECAAGTFTGSANTASSCEVCAGIVGGGSGGTDGGTGGTSCEVCVNGARGSGENVCECGSGYEGRLCDAEVSRSVTVWETVGGGGVVSAEWSGLSGSVAEGASGTAGANVLITFRAVPSGTGFYVSGWRGSCSPLAGPESAGTGAGDSAGGGEKLCVLAAGDSDVFAGAEFSSTADCGTESRVRLTASECGGCLPTHYDADDGAGYDCRVNVVCDLPLTDDDNNSATPCVVTAKTCGDAHSDLVPSADRTRCERPVSVSASGTGGAVSATWSGLPNPVGDGAAGQAPRTAGIVFTATPADGNYYVSRWTGNCDGNSSATTGADDSDGGVAKTCEVAAGDPAVVAGAEFSMVRNCGSENRKEADGVSVCGTCADDYEDVDGTCSACTVSNSGSTGGAACGCDSGFADPDTDDATLECAAILSASDCNTYGGGLTDNNTACDCSSARGFSGESCDVCASPNVRTVQGSVVSCEAPGPEVCARAEGGGREFRDGACVLQCAAGQEWDAGAGQCAACGAGTYNPTAGGTCGSCAGITGDGSGNKLNSGATSCAECENGGTRDDANNACECAGDYTGTICDTLPGCPANSSRTTDADKCVCDSGYRAAASSPSSGTDVVCELRTVAVSDGPDDNGSVSANWASNTGDAIDEGGNGNARTDEDITFTATPDGGYYVSGWTGDCDNNSSAGTGESDAVGGTPKTCVVGAGTGDVEAGATFAEDANCESENRERTNAATCGNCISTHTPDTNGDCREILTCSDDNRMDGDNAYTCGDCLGGHYNADTAGGYDCRPIPVCVLPLVLNDDNPAAPVCETTDATCESFGGNENAKANTAGDGCDCDYEGTFPNCDGPPVCRNGGTELPDGSCDCVGTGFRGTICNTALSSALGGSANDVDRRCEESGWAASVDQTRVLGSGRVCTLGGKTVQRVFQNRTLEGASCVTRNRSAIGGGDCGAWFGTARGVDDYILPLASEVGGNDTIYTNCESPMVPNLNWSACVAAQTSCGANGVLRERVRRGGGSGVCLCDDGHSGDRCEVDDTQRNIAVSESDNGIVSATWAGRGATPLAEGETATAAKALGAVFTATPATGYYVVRWTGFVRGRGGSDSDDDDRGG